MLSAGPGAESLAVLQVLQALLVALQRKGVMTKEEIEALLIETTKTVRATKLARTDETVDLLNRLRAEVLKA